MATLDQRLGHHPEPGTSLASAVPVLADAGSLIFWHGNTWHGATARTAAGARMSLQVTMCRPFIRPQEMYREHLPDEVIDANPPRFAALVGRHFYGWTEQGGDGTRIVRDGPRSSYE